MASVNGRPGVQKRSRTYYSLSQLNAKAENVKKIHKIFLRIFAAGGSEMLTRRSVPGTTLVRTAPGTKRPCHFLAIPGNV